METAIRGNLFSVAAVCSLSAAGAVIACTVVVANTYYARLEHPQKINQSLAVTGSARKRIRSDLAIWRIQLSEEGPDMKSGFVKLKNSTDRVSKFLEARQFPTEEIALSAISSQPKYGKDRWGNDSKEISGYTLNRSFTVTSPRVDAAAKAASDVTELIQEGLNVVSDLPEYYYTKIGDLKIEMIGEAAKDARTRADQIVSKAGCQLAEVRTAHMGVLQITKPESTEVSASGIYDTVTIDKDVTAVVKLTYGLANK